MARAELCKNCINEENCKENRCYCHAMNELFSIYNDSKKQIAQNFIDEYRQWLSIVDAEQAKEYEDIAKNVIDSIEELQYISELDIKVGYVKSYEAKIKDGRVIYGDCRKVNEIFQCFIPFDFIITLYEPNIMLLSENQIKVLLWHELRHIGINERTLKTEYKLMPHEVEDFHSILDRFGTRWNMPDAQIEDICNEV